MENIQLLENYSRKRKNIKAFVFICLAIFFDYLCLYALKDKFLSLLVTKYDLTLNKAQSNKLELYSFFLLMAGIGGMISDFLLSRILLVILCYIFSFFGIIGLILLEFNSNQKAHVPVLCKFQSDDTYPPKCKVFLYLINILIGWGTGIIRVMLYVIAMDQIRPFGARAVSISLFILYGICQLAGILVDIQSIIVRKDTPLRTFTYFLIGIIGCLILSFILFVIGRWFAEFRRPKQFVKEYFEAVKELYRSWRLGESFRNLFHNTKIRLQLESRDLNDSLECIKRSNYFCIMWWLLIPCCTIMSQIDLNNVQFRLFRQASTLPFNGNLANSCTVLITLLLFICLSLKYLHRGEVFSYKWRLILGTALGILAAIYSGVLESVRLKKFWIDNDTVFNNNNHTKLYANLNIFSLLPAYMLSGISEVLICVTGFEYAYLSMSPNVQSSAIGLVWSSWGMGSIFASLFFNGFDGVFYDKGNPNELDNSNGHLDYFYYILSLFSLVSFVIIMTILLKFLPSIFNPCFIGLEERLLGDDVDEPEEDSEEEDEHFYLRSRRLFSQISNRAPSLV